MIKKSYINPVGIKTKLSQEVEKLITRQKNRDQDHSLNYGGEGFPVFDKKDWNTGNNIFGYNVTYPNRYKYQNQNGDYIVQQVKNRIPEGKKESIFNVAIENNNLQPDYYRGYDPMQFKEQNMRSINKGIENLSGSLGNGIRSVNPQILVPGVFAGQFAQQKFQVNPLLRRFGVVDGYDERETLRTSLVSAVLQQLAGGISMGRKTASLQTKKAFFGGAESVIANSDMSQSQKQSLLSQVGNLNIGEKNELSRLLASLTGGAQVSQLLQYLFSIGKVPSYLLGQGAGWMINNFIKQW